MQPTVIIEHIASFSSDLTEQLNYLLPQLSSDAKLLTDTDMQFMLDSSTNRLFVAREPDTKKIIGMLTLIIYRIPIIKKGVLEDLVVAEEFRGWGVATSLLEAAIGQAKKEQITYIDFTSNPAREAANHLYQKLGFEKRDTNVYRLDLRK